MDIWYIGMAIRKTYRKMRNILKNWKCWWMEWFVVAVLFLMKYLRQHTPSQKRKPVPPGAPSRSTMAPSRWSGCRRGHGQRFTSRPDRLVAPPPLPRAVMSYRYVAGGGGGSPRPRPVGGGRSFGWWLDKRAKKKREKKLLDKVNKGTPPLAHAPPSFACDSTPRKLKKKKGQWPKSDM